jgi:hypothetical protein
MKFAMICLAALAAGTCFAQGDSIHYFHLNFVVKEMDAGKVISAHNYSATVSSKVTDHSSVRTVDKVPVPTGSGGFTYVDVGVNLDANVERATDTELILSVTADISSVASAISSGASQPGPPIVRQNRWNGKVVVPLKKPTTIYSADSAADKRQMQIEVTATPIL